MVSGRIFTEEARESPLEKRTKTVRQEEIHYMHREINVCVYIYTSLYNFYINKICKFKIFQIKNIKGQVI